MNLSPSNANSICSCLVALCTHRAALLSLSDETQELLPSFGCRAQAAEHAASCGGSAGLLHAAHDHAEVGRFDDDGDALWLKYFRESHGHLFGKALLYLESAGEHFGDASEL